MFERVEEDSPLRCQATIPSRGQCINKRMDGSEYCPAHGGNRSANKKNRMYMIERFQSRMDKMEDHSGFKSLTGEIAILRMMLEARLQKCKDDHDLMMHSQNISQLAVQIEKLVVSCNNLDMKLSRMLDANQALHWMSEIVDIISRYVQDEAVLDDISTDILDSYERIKG